MLCNNIVLSFKYTNFTQLFFKFIESNLFTLGDSNLKNDFFDVFLDNFQFFQLGPNHRLDCLDQLHVRRSDQGV